MVAFLNARPKIPMVTFLSNISFTHNMLANESRMGYQQAQSPYLSALDYWHSLVCDIKFDELDFFSSLNWIFAAWQAVKIQFKLEKKNQQFVKLKISN